MTQREIAALLHSHRSTISGRLLRLQRRLKAAGFPVTYRGKGRRPAAPREVDVDPSQLNNLAGERGGIQRWLPSKKTFKPSDN